MEERVTILITGKAVPDEVSIKNGDCYVMLVGSDNVINMEKAINLLSKLSDLAVETFRDCSVEVIINDENDEIIIDSVQCPNEIIQNKFNDEVVKKLIFKSHSESKNE